MYKLSESKNYQRLLERDAKNVSRVMYRYTPVAFERGEGCYLFDIEGNRYLDFAAGIATCAVGHCHPQVVQAVKEQAENLLHLMNHVGYYEPYVKFVETLKKVLPGDLSQGTAFLLNSGTEAVEAALKLARVVTGRPAVISFTGAFHGRGMGALGVTTSTNLYRKGLNGLFAGVYYTPYPHCFRCFAGQESPQECSYECISFLEALLKTTLHPEDVATILVEPIQGEAGYRVPPDSFLPRLREICDSYGMLLIADEIQTGMGRTGKMLATEHWNVVPDVVCLAKAFGGGLPLSAVIAKKKLMDQWDPGAHGSTFGGNPVAIAAGHATLDIILRKELMSNAHKIGEYIQERFREAADEMPQIGDVRGKGLMIGVELVKDESKTPAFDETKKLTSGVCEKGLILATCGKNTLRICPPLILTQEEAREGVDIILDTLREVF